MVRGTGVGAKSCVEYNGMPVGDAIVKSGGWKVANEQLCC